MRGVWRIGSVVGKHCFEPEKRPIERLRALVQNSCVVPATVWWNLSLLFTGGLVMEASETWRLVKYDTMRIIRIIIDSDSSLDFWF